MGEKIPAARKLDIDELQRLPAHLRELIGRGGVCGEFAAALASDKTAVVGITAPGGTGKSVLLRGWLEDPEEAASLPERVWACKFTDVSKQTTASSNSFINAFLAAEVTGSEDRKAQQLLQRFREAPMILVLDSLEALQEQGADGSGRIEDEAIRRFLVQAAGRDEGNAGSLIIVTSRERLPDLKGLAGFRRIELKPLDDKGGAKLLEKLGVQGSDKDRRDASQDFGGNPLALVLLAGLIRARKDSNAASVHQEIRIFDPARVHQEIRTFEREQVENPQGLDQAERILRYYLGRGLDTPGERVLLRMMGLFHRPMQRAERDVLLSQAAFAADFKEWDKKQWAKVHKRLVGLGLLSAAGKDSSDEGSDGEKLGEQSAQEIRDDGDEDAAGKVAQEQAAEDIRDAWDCHPLVREHFRERFSVEEPEQWRQAQGVLFDYFKGDLDKPPPKTRDELVPVYRSIHHGCWAERYQEALSVYKNRIMQGPLCDLGANELGAISEDSAALRMFFEPEKTELKSGVLELKVHEQAWLHARTAFCLTTHRMRFLNDIHETLGATWLALFLSGLIVFRFSAIDALKQTDGSISVCDKVVFVLLVSAVCGLAALSALKFLRDSRGERTALFARAILRIILVSAACFLAWYVSFDLFVLFWVAFGIMSLSYLVLHTNRVHIRRRIFALLRYHFVEDQRRENQ